MPLKCALYILVPHQSNVFAEMCFIRQFVEYVCLRHLRDRRLIQSRNLGIKGIVDRLGVSNASNASSAVIETGKRSWLESASFRQSARSPLFWSSRSIQFSVGSGAKATLE